MRISLLREYLFALSKIVYLNINVYSFFFHSEPPNDVADKPNLTWLDAAQVQYFFLNTALSVDYCMYHVDI